MTQSQPPNSPRSAAQRQAERRRRLQSAGEYQRLNLWLDAKTYAALTRLTRHHAITQAQLLAPLIHSADDAVIATLDDRQPEWDAYFLGSLPRLTHAANGADMT